MKTMNFVAFLHDDFFGEIVFDLAAEKLYFDVIVDELNDIYCLFIKKTIYIVDELNDIHIICMRLEILTM